MAPARSARVLLRRRCPSVPALPSRAGRAAVRVSWPGCSGGCAAERRARGQLLPPGAAPPPSACPASRAAAASPAPRAQRPRPRLGGRTGLKGPDVCGRLSPARSRPPPPHPATHALAAARPPPGSANFYFDSGWRVGGAAGDAQDPRAGGRAGSQVPSQGVMRRGEPGRATQRWGLRVFILSFPFSLCLLQDLKGQPRPRRPARRPRFLRSPDALCGPAGPAHTGALVRNCRVFSGAHPARGSQAAEFGSVARCTIFCRVRLGWKIKLLNNCFPTQKGAKRSEKFLYCSRNFIERPKTPRRYQ